MPGFELFERDLRLVVADLDPAVIQRELAAYAKRSVTDVVSSGQAPAIYDRYVNGRLGAPEESVTLPGPIVYVFSNWRLAIETALTELERRVPRRSGRYAASFIATVGGSIVTDFSNIAPESEVVILNAQPYTRKMEVGANKTGARHFELAKGAFNRRFGGAFAASTMFLNAKSGIHPLIPYILKGNNGRRKDSQAGAPITYPALVLNAVT
jgi:hypothetical protein